MRGFLLCAVLAVAGCWDTTPSTTETSGNDRDGDGMPDSRDCAPGDRDRYRTANGLFVDADGDGYRGSAEPMAVCLGRLPGDIIPGYTRAESALDCDDADASRQETTPGYRDADGDGIGAGSAEMLCMGGELPATHTAMSGDCAPEDRNAWRELSYVSHDGDLDGFGTYQPGVVCAGEALPPGYVNEVLNADCDDANASAFFGVPSYADADGDGVGAGYPDEDGDGIGASPRVISCIGDALPAGYSRHGYDPDDKDPSLSDASDDALLIELL